MIEHHWTWGEPVRWFVSRVQDTNHRTNWEISAQQDTRGESRTGLNPGCSIIHVKLFEVWCRVPSREKVCAKMSAPQGAREHLAFLSSRWPFDTGWYTLVRWLNLWTSGACESSLLNISAKKFRLDLLFEKNSSVFSPGIYILFSHEEAQKM